MPVDFPNLHVKNDRDSSVRQRTIPTASELQTTSGGPMSLSGDAISAFAAEPALSLIRRPMFYEPLSRRSLSTTLLKLPAQAKLRADDFSINFNVKHHADEMIAYTGCLDGKYPFARIRIGNAIEIDVRINYDQLHGLVQIECFDLPKDQSKEVTFWERATASAAERIVASIGNSIIGSCTARKIPISVDSSNLVRFHHMDEHYQRIRSHPRSALAQICRSHYQRDVASGEYFP